MAQHSNYAISKCAWEHHNKQQVINLVLSSHTEGQVFEELDEQHKAVIRGLHSIKAAASDRVAGIKLFEEADEGTIIVLLYHMVKCVIYIFNLNTK